MPTLRDRGIEIELSYDEDGFPSIRVNAGGNYSGEYSRPTVEIVLEGVTVHDMFDNEENGKDYRWVISKEAITAARDAIGNDEYPVEDILAAQHKYRDVDTSTLWRELEDKMGLSTAMTRLFSWNSLAADEVAALRMVIAIRNLKG